MLGLLKKSGMKVNDLILAEKAELKKLCMPIYKQLESKLGADLLKKVMDANKKKRYFINKLNGGRANEC